MKGNTEDILDQTSTFFKDHSIDLDLKMVRVFALSYFVYGLVYWIQIQEFLVPLPMVYFFVPLAGLVMFTRSINWLGSILYLLVPFLVVKDLVLVHFPTITGVVALLTFLLWSVWSGIVFTNQKERGVKSYVFLVSQQMIWLLWALPFEWMQIVLMLVILIGITLFVREHLDVKKQVYNVRLGLLIQLIISLYLMQKVSVIWVASS